jgi:LCP family protein required for cell wall assembly
MTLNTYSSQNARSGKSRTNKADVPVKKGRRIGKRIGIGVGIIMLLAVGWLGWKFLYNAHKLFGGNPFSALTSGRLKGESNGRVNILLAGNSADDPGHQGATLTDSIMILSVDTKNHTAFMLSVPRDLYVSVPGHGHQKINTVFPVGESSKFEQSGYAKGGMGLLQKTIQQDLGITTQYYALVNYNALRDAVNSVGGIDINIQSSDKRGLYDPNKDWSTGGVLVKLSNGWHHLNGQQALNLARARGDSSRSYGFANSDFTRAEHQRQLILALRSKATSAGVVTNPIRLGSLFDSIGGNVKTNFTLGNVRRLYDITKELKGNNIQSIGLNDANGKNLLKNYRTPRGESALIPAAGLDDFSDIQRYLQQLTSTNLLVREGADVVVLNGTSRNGLASQERDKLEDKNISVNAVGDADSENYATTQIIDLSKGGKPNTRTALQKIYPGSTVTTINPYGSKYKSDFIVVLGTDRLPAATNQ